ncbi:hypothetical protein [Salinimonas sediminis]|uniref:Uncharacterized protein n=1 Tax=Salinimonas sediminis TaxID=2303538 RepID=A0A346NN64_9ALTE|nr:hypothetical protein [Salinimonas sediminis]AXR06971.1 hypothetical protein D0Y50_11775 [Salinimonas sediminis]
MKNSPSLLFLFNGNASNNIEGYSMKLLKTKRYAKPENRFQQYLQSQPVFNWFDRYDDKKNAEPVSYPETSQSMSWIAKRVGE